MDNRKQQIQQWLTTEAQLTEFTLEPASEDASFRRYFRVRSKKNIFIVMDAPPQQEPVDDFLRITALLQKIGLHAPKILAKNTQAGFLLLEDLGTRVYLNELNTNSATPLYTKALDALSELQRSTINTEKLPAYTQEAIQEELDVFTQWYLEKTLNIPLNQHEKAQWKALCHILVDAFHAQEQVLVHRDYHSRNLLVTKENSPGIIDYQDMCIGPVCYDAVSLLKDCYIQWPRAQQLEWLELLTKNHNSSISATQWQYWFDMTGIQRHLKVLGVFCRLHLRDNKPQYLQDLPLVEHYILEALTQHKATHPFVDFFTTLFAKRQNDAK